MNRTDLRVLLTTAAAATVCVFPVFLAGAMAVQIRDDLGFSAAGTGLGFGAFFASASLGSAAFGRRVERFGAARSLRVAALWSAVVQLAVAGLARSLPALVIGLALAGWSNALAQPAANHMVARALPVRRQGLGFAVKQAAIPAATLLAGLAVPTVALTAGWRFAFVGSAALAVVAAWSVPDVAGEAKDAMTGSQRAPRGAMVLLSCGVAFGAAAAGTLGSFLVSAGVDAGLAPGVAGLTLSAGSAIGLFARIYAGVRADRRTGGHLRVVTGMLVVGSVAYLALALGRPVPFLLAVPIVFGAGWSWPGLFNLAVVRANPGSPAAATGVTQTGTYLGAFAGPLLFGLVAEHAGFGAAWTAAGASSLAAAGAIWAGRAALHPSSPPASSPPAQSRA